jgi:hypothetical protein
MADDVVISAERLGKKYLIGHAAERERYVALRDVLVRGTHISGARRRIWRGAAPSSPATRSRSSGREKM